MAVNGRVTDPEQVQIGAVEDVHGRQANPPRRSPAYSMRSRIGESGFTRQAPPCLGIVRSATPQPGPWEPGRGTECQAGWKTSVLSSMLSRGGASAGVV